MIELNEKQNKQMIFSVLYGVQHDISHCISNIDLLMKNKFIEGIKVEINGKEVTIGEMMKYQKEKLIAIETFFSTSTNSLYKSDRENLPDFFLQSIIKDIEK
jgi:hypothetical protein